MNQDKKSLAVIVGASLVSSLSVAQAAENPFVMNDLQGGYMQLAEVVPYKGKEATTGASEAKPAADAKGGSMEGKCGAEMMKSPEMKCGASMMPGMGDMKAPEAASDKKAMEGKCAGMK